MGVWTGDISAFITDDAFDPSARIFAWKGSYAETRELGLNVLIISCPTNNAMTLYQI